MRFRVPGGPFFGAIVNGRWFEAPVCRDKRCNYGGPHQHWFDLATGHLVTEPAVERGPDGPAEQIRKAG